MPDDLVLVEALRGRVRLRLGGSTPPEIAVAIVRFAACGSAGGPQGADQKAPLATVKSATSAVMSRKAVTSGRRSSRRLCSA